MSASVVGCTGMVPSGERRGRSSLSKKTFAKSTVEPEGRVRAVPPGFWKTPSLKCGDLRMRARRSPLGSVPKPAGCSARSPELRERKPDTVPPDGVDEAFHYGRLLRQHLGRPGRRGLIPRKA